MGPIRRVGHLAGLAVALVTIVGALSVAGLALPSAARAAVLTVDQCNGVGPGPRGATTGMDCAVSVVNTIDGATIGSTTSVTRTCTLDPCPLGNGTFTSRSTSLVTAVTQCNGSDNDAAHPITCTVDITNRISAGTPGATPTAATVNQCVGSGAGGGGTVDCDPFPATTTGATVTQCNGSGNGGGGTVHCTVATTSPVMATIPVTVNQCNGTGNPGGSVVTCHTSLTTITLPRAGSPSPTPTPTAGGSATPAPTPTATAGGSSPVPSAQVSLVPTGGVATGGGSTSGLRHVTLLAFGGALLLAVAATAVLRRRPGRRG